MVVGQAPGRREIESHLPFSGPAGKRLFSWLETAGFSERRFREQQYMTAITKCYPGKGSARGDRLPTAVERALCAPFLERELALVDPEVVVPVGGVATGRFLGKGPLAQWVGAVHTRDDRLIVPLPHPSGANLWLNRTESQALLAAALDALSELRKRLSL
jgi:uracil-DNA glycosylase